MNSILKFGKSFITCPAISSQTVRHGHQMSTRWQKSAVIPKRRGLKVFDGEKIKHNSMLCKQRYLKFFPGSNARMSGRYNIFATAPGIVKFSCERFDPDFDNPTVQSSYGDRSQPRMYKKYINVIPLPQHNRFKLVDVI